MGIWSWLTGTIERPSPGNWLNNVADSLINGFYFDQFGNQRLRKAYVNVGLEEDLGIWIPEIPDTNSMDGVFDDGHNNILGRGYTQRDHYVLIGKMIEGDIAVYRHPQMWVIHRVVKIKGTSGGRIFLFKGDNNAIRDPYWISESMIEWVSLGTLY